ncbi:MAG TPA: tyrosine-type recombinase/integrase [Candidatus Didemnitutus sp.]|nr:tyrosine-type recombinase/integrase [Candidatus Didemnitutus sp.]
MAEIASGDTITREVAERWFESMDHLSPGTRINRMSVLRQFCLYLSHFDPRTCIVHRIYMPRRRHSAPYIYRPNEVRRIVAAARRIGPHGTLRPLVMATVIGLLYSTGLRIGEALKLDVADVDLQRRVLHIRNTKFKKSRYVPISPSTAAHLAAYLRRLRKSGGAATPQSPFFVTTRGNRGSQSGVTTAFLDIVRTLRIRAPTGRGPRIHDFRHSFCVNRLLAWYRSGDNLYAKLPVLSTYVGHTTVSGTEVYLHATAELLESAGKRFREHFAVPPIPRPRHRYARS